MQLRGIECLLNFGLRFILCSNDIELFKKINCKSRPIFCVQFGLMKHEVSAPSVAAIQSWRSSNYCHLTYMPNTFQVLSGCFRTHLRYSAGFYANKKLF